MKLTAISPVSARWIRWVAILMMALLFGAAGSLPVVLHADAATGTSYVMIDLGTLGGSTSVAVAINEAGQVVGHATTAGGEIHAFLWEDGVMTDLGTLGGSTCWAVDINEAGQVIGISDLAGWPYIHAFVWADGVMTDLGTLGGSTHAVDINEAGQVVGYSDTVGIHTQHAFLWADGVMTNLGTLGGSTHAVDINEAGQVVGGSYTAGAFSHYAFVWEDGVMTNLGTLGGSTSSATDINEAGQVVGYSDTVGIHTQHAFLATPATPQTPQEATQSIIDTIAALVASGDLPHGVGNALTAKLEAAIQQLDRGNTRAAANQLTAFINQVESLIAEGLLSAEDGEPLIEAARDILETIT